jgi:hypothetical protein
MIDEREDVSDVRSVDGDAKKLVEAGCRSGAHKRRARADHRRRGSEFPPPHASFGDAQGTASRVHLGLW